jgi:hypothetical protein
MATSIEVRVSGGMDLQLQAWSKLDEESYCKHQMYSS